MKSELSLTEIKLSPSAINTFAQCRRKFLYSRTIEVIDASTPIYFVRGTEAHEVMDGTKHIDDVSAEAATMARKMRVIRDGFGITIERRELTQKWNLAANVVYERRIDALGRDRDGFGLIVDWKTASREWTVIPVGSGLMASKALTWQTPGYLLPPPGHVLEEIGWADPWPRAIEYIVGPSRGNGQRFRVTNDQGMIDEFLGVVEDIREAAEVGRFPRSPGMNCDYCAYAARCWQATGHERMYRERE